MKAKLIAFYQEFREIWGHEKPARQAAALAYYALFSIAPAIFVAVTFAEFFVEGLLGQFLQRVSAQLESTAGAEAVQAFEEVLLGVEGLGGSEGSTLVSLISLGALLYAATSFFAQLKFSLNSVWGVPIQKELTIQEFIRTRLLAFGLVLGMGLVLIVSSIMSLLLTLLANELNLNDATPIGGILILGALFVLMFALLYKILPDAEVSWRDVWPGAILAGIGVTIGGWVVIMYLTRISLGSAFEAAGAFAIFLIFFYYMAQIFLVGALMTRIYANLFGANRTTES